MMLLQQHHTGTHRSGVPTTCAHKAQPLGGVTCAMWRRAAASAHARPELGAAAASELQRWGIGSGSAHLVCVVAGAGQEQAAPERDCAAVGARKLHL